VTTSQVSVLSFDTAPDGHSANWSDYKFTGEASPRGYKVK